MTAFLIVMSTVLPTLAVFAGWRHSARNQERILQNTVKILALCESLETFYVHAVDSRKVVDMVVAAGIAHETLQENLHPASLN